MGIIVNFLEAAADALDPEVRDEIESKGALNPDYVRVRYRTQEDDKVRPAHEAMDGMIGRPGAPDFPVPPCGYGCRCYVEYLGVEGTPGAHFLPSTSAEISTVIEQYAKYLDKNFSGWRKVREAIKGLAKFEQMGAAALAVKKALSDLDSADSQEYARMVVQADPT